MPIRGKTEDSKVRKVRTPRATAKTNGAAAVKVDPVKELKTRISSLEKIIRVHEKTITKLLTSVEKLKGGPKAGPKAKVTVKPKRDKEENEEKKGKTKKISLRKKLKQEKKDKKLRRRKSED